MAVADQRPRYQSVCLQLAPAYQQIDVFFGVVQAPLCGHQVDPERFGR